MAKLFLGLDSSTQSLSAVLIDYETRKVVYEKSLNYDRALPQYKTQNGVLRDENPLVKHSDPRMWCDALDLLFAEMKRDDVALGEILAISGSGQQHGSVYLNHRGEDELQNLSPFKPLVGNLRGGFSRGTSPIWMDSSTSKECSEIREALGGLEATAQKTGSDAFERFTGPQIRKFFKTEISNYNETTNIALVSSFMASVIAGKIAPIDFGDGAGMNLMDIHKKVWHSEALAATAPDLEKKLPPLAESGKVIGKVSGYFVKKYGLNPEARATVWTGDNPASVIGLGLIREGMVAISLGTSDTYFGSMQKCQTDTRGEGHVFGSPAGGYMSLICFKNGSLAREKIREHYKIKDWNEFGKLVNSTKPNENGGIILPCIHRFDLDEKNVAANCRAIFESQMLSMRLHSQWMKVSPEKIYATGGASNDLALLQIMADVMNCRLERIEISKSAALGAALMAAHGWLAAAGEKPNWEKIVSGFTEPVLNSEIRPNPKVAPIYDKLVEKYATCEREALAKI
jgi:xylulokinase